MATRDDAEESATTFRHYFEAFRACCRDRGHDDAPELSDEQRRLPWFRSAQPDASVSPLLKKHLFRGWLTLTTMRQLPIEKAPDLAIGASMWLPVQAYYACHGVGLATLHALGCNSPNEDRLRHSGFLRVMSNNVVKPTFFVPPFDLRCGGDCRSNGEVFQNTVVSPEEVREAHHLRPPSDARHAEALIAKALKTTRRELLEKRAADKCRREKRKRLKAGDRQVIAGSLHITTCLDFVYRMRVRSNYDEADLFLFGQEQRQAVRYSLDVIWLTDALCCQLDNVIRQKLGCKAFATLERDFRAAGGAVD